MGNLNITDVFQNLKLLFKELKIILSRLIYKEKAVEPWQPFIWELDFSCSHYFDCPHHRIYSCDVSLSKTQSIPWNCIFKPGVLYCSNFHLMSFHFLELIIVVCQYWKFPVCLFFIYSFFYVDFYQQCNMTASKFIFILRLQQKLPC